MSDWKKRDAIVWERFFEFIMPPTSDDAPIADVEAELTRRGIDTKPAFAKVKRALAAVRARAELEAARAKRPGLVEQISSIVAPPIESVRENVRKKIERLTAPQQAAYYRKLEGAASDDDLRSLLDDLRRLDAMTEGGDAPEAPE